MPFDAFIQVAQDGTGKQVDMDRVVTPAGDTIYRQRAALIGESLDVLRELLATSYAQLAVSRATLAVLNNMSNAPITEDDIETT